MTRTTFSQFIIFVSPRPDNANTMNRSTRRFLWNAAVFLLLLATPACRSTEGISTNSTKSPLTSRAAVDPTELEAQYWARQESARTRYTDADIQLMTGMISHHAQALIMAGLVPDNGESSQVKTLAARIINAQKDEIATMQNWLGDRGQPVPEVKIEELTLTIDGAGDHAIHMPGMLTAEQLSELQETSGTAFDQLFLTYMIQHHRGAVTMVADLFAHDGAGQDELAFKLASDINVDQITEIARMEILLDTLSDS